MLAAENADAALPSSTLMKVMTVLVTLELFGEDETVSVSAAAAAQSTPKASLKAGAMWKVIDLVAAVLLAGDNDAAVALGDAAAARGGKPLDVLAAETAQRLGLTGTTLATATGKGADTLTPKDLAIIANNLMSLSSVADITQQLTYRTKDPNGYDIRFDNTNGIVSIMTDSVGLFTSGRPENGPGIVAVVDQTDRRLIAVAMGTSNPFQKVNALVAAAPKTTPAAAPKFPAARVVSYQTRDQIARAMPQVLGGGRPGSADPASAPALGSGPSSTAASSSSATSTKTSSGGDDGIGFGTIFLLFLLALSIAIVARREQIKARKRHRRAMAMRMYEKERRYLDVYRGPERDRPGQGQPLRPAVRRRDTTTESSVGHVKLVRNTDRD
ncbi:MAG: hypothetical protein WBD02_06200 [Acidimicrobiia bacterium]